MFSNLFSKENEDVKDLKIIPERAAVESIQDREEAILKISTLDGDIIIPIIKQILVELRQRNEQEINNILKDTSIGSIRKFVEKKLNKELRDELEKLCYGTKAADLTEKKITINIDALVNVFCDTVPKNKEVPSESERLKLLICNEISLIWIYEVYFDINKQQNAEISDLALLIPSILAKSIPAREVLTNPFIMIQHIFNKISFKEQDKPLWKNLLLWIEGLHARSFYQLPKPCQVNRVSGEVTMLEDGSYPLLEGKNNSNDKYIRKLKIGLYELALYNLHVASALKKILHPAEIAQKKINANDIDQKDSFQSTSPLILFSPLPAAASAKPILQVEQLILIEACQDEDKFDDFLTLLENYQIENSILAFLHSIHKRIKQKFEEYPKGIWRSTLYIPTILTGGREHDEGFANKLKEIQAITDVVQKIILVIGFWNEIKEKGSIRGKQLISQLINEIFGTILRACKSVAISRGELVQSSMSNIPKKLDMS